MPGLINKNIPSIGLWAGFFIFCAMEVFIWRPDWWGGIPLAVILVFLLLRIIAKEYHILNAYHALGLILVPGIAALFFVDLVLWQHLFALGLALTVVLLFRYITQAVVIKEYNEAAVIFPLANVFFTALVALGLLTFFRLDVVYGTLIFGISVVLFPITLRVKPRRELDVGLEELPRAVYFWPRDAVEKKTLFDSYQLGSLKFFHKREILLYGISAILLVSAMQLFLVVATLPLNVIVGASVITVILFGLWSLITYSQTNSLQPFLIYRYIGITLFFTTLLLLTAQWS